MAGHSASEDARERAYVPTIHVFLEAEKTWMPGTRPGMTIPGPEPPSSAILECGRSARIRRRSFGTLRRCVRLRPRHVMQRPAGIRGGGERVGEPEREAFRTCPGNHSAVVGAQPRRR